MDKYIEIWTDGSYRGGEGGCSFYINTPGTLEEQILVYTKVKAKRSVQVELLSIIYAIKYLYYLKFNLKEYHIRIMTDEFTIADSFTNRKYEDWEEKGWRKRNGKAIKSSICEWFTLTCLVKAITLNNIQFIKVESKKDKFNKFVDKYANYARKQKLLDEEQFYILEYDETQNEFLQKNVIGSIDSYMSNEILKSKNPWQKLEQSKRIKWLYNEEDVVYIEPLKITIKEDVHLDCNQLVLNGMIRRVLENGQIKTPIVIRKQGEFYLLVSGITRLVAAKLLNIHRIPCVVVELNHTEFIKKNTIIVNNQNIIE